MKGLAIISLVFACGGGISTPEDLAAALEAAAPGDEVRLGNGRIQGTFVVPAGVRVRGEGQGRSIIVVGAGERGFTIEEGDQVACLSDLSIESSGTVAIKATGNICIERVTVAAALGVGVALGDLTRANLIDVEIRGPVTAANVSAIGLPAMPDLTATYGLLLNHVVEAVLERVDVSGFATAGVDSIESGLTWNRGSSSANRRVGLLTSGGEVSLSEVELSDTMSGGRFFAYGAAFTASTSVTSDHLVVRGNESLGILQDSGAGVHQNLEAHANGYGGISAQTGSSVEVTGALSENRLAGVVAYRAARVFVHDAEIVRSIAVPHLAPMEPPSMIGDGIQLVESTADLRLENVTLTDNPRAGVLLHLAGTTLDGSTIQNVSVTGSGDALGVVFQGGSAALGWDSGITRGGDVGVNDQAFSGGLGIVGPCDFPRPE